MKHSKNVLTTTVWQFNFSPFVFDFGCRSIVVVSVQFVLAFYRTGIPAHGVYRPLLAIAFSPVAQIAINSLPVLCKRISLPLLLKPRDLRNCRPWQRLALWAWIGIIVSSQFSVIRPVAYLSICWARLYSAILYFQCAVFTVVPHVQNALYFWRKVRALWRPLLCERTSRFSRLFISVTLSLI